MSDIGEIACHIHHAPIGEGACPCPPLGGEGAGLNYRALWVTARAKLAMRDVDAEDTAAEIARLTAELAAARAVPADVEVEIQRLAACEPDDRDDLMAAIADLRAAIARAIAAAGAAQDAEWRRAIDELRLPLPATPDALAAGLIAVTRPPATVGGLLGSYPIVEWRLGEDWHQARIAQRGSGLIRGAEMRWRHHRASSWSSWGQPWGDPAQHMDEPARLVPADQADSDPVTRGPLPKGG